MKKVFKQTVVIGLGMLFLVGCTKHINKTISISKEKSLELVYVEEALSQHSPNGQFNGAAFNLDTEGEQRLKVVIKINGFVSSAYDVLLNPCSSNKNYETVMNDYPEEAHAFSYGYPYPLHEPEAVNNEYTTAYAYYNIELLKSLGYIAKNEEKQEDLCVFLQYTLGKGDFGVSEEVHYKSNKLIYTAEEITDIVEEYEANR